MPELQRPRHGALLVGRGALDHQPADRAAAEAQHRHLDPGPPELALFHRPASAAMAAVAPTQIPPPPPVNSRPMLTCWGRFRRGFSGGEDGNYGRERRSGADRGSRRRQPHPLQRGRRRRLRPCQRAPRQAAAAFPPGAQHGAGAGHRSRHHGVRPRRRGGRRRRAAPPISNASSTARSTRRAPRSTPSSTAIRRRSSRSGWWRAGCSRSTT